MSWMDTKNLYTWIFNTGRGLAVCLRFPDNRGILYDLGSSDDFSPTEFVRTKIAPYLTHYSSQKIAQCILSHPHADHIREVDAITKREQTNRALVPHLITCPNEKGDGEALDFSRIENKDNANLMASYRKSYAERKPPLKTIVPEPDEAPIPDFEYGLYYMRPPAVSRIHPSNDHHYGNGVSILMYVRYGKMSLLLPGDVTPEVLADILLDRETIEKRYSRFYQGGPGNTADWHTARSGQPGLGALLGERGLSVLVAPHHGLESCYSEDLFHAIRGGKPILNVISDKRKALDTDGSVHSRYHDKDGAFGLAVDIKGTPELRYGVSTKNGQHILVVFRARASQPAVYLRSDPAELLAIE
jgi:beta-lactamase superfamily II metal-dependent hydrolase